MLQRFRLSRELESSPNFQLSAKFFSTPHWNQKPYKKKTLQVALTCIEYNFFRLVTHFFPLCISSITPLSICVEDDGLFTQRKTWIIEDSNDRSSLL